MCLYLSAVPRYQERQQFWWLQPVGPLWDLLISLHVGFALGEFISFKVGPRHWDLHLRSPEDPVVLMGLRHWPQLLSGKSHFGRTVNVAYRTQAMVC